MTSIQEILATAKQKGKQRVVIVSAEDDDVLGAISKASQEGIARGILIGKEDKIIQLAQKHSISLEDMEIIDVANEEKAVILAVHLLQENKADLIMKGAISTGKLLKILLSREMNLRTDRLVSHIGVFEVSGWNKLMYISDAAINIRPSIYEKIAICRNAVEVARKLGNPHPKVAFITPFTKVYLDKIPSTVDAALISKMNDCGQITDADIEGPIALDLAVSKEAAEIKLYKSNVAGDCDIFITHDIEAGNVFYKALVYLAKAKMAGIVAGARVPIIMTSRADSEDIKLASIALGCVLIEK